MSSNHATTWKTGDGVVIKIRDMENSHLVNSLNYLIRAAKTKFDAELEGVLHIPSFGPDTMAAFYAEQEFDTALHELHDEGWQQFLSYKFFNLMKEFRRRELAWNLLNCERKEMKQCLREMH